MDLIPAAGAKSIQSTLTILIFPWRNEKFLLKKLSFDRTANRF